MNKMKSKNKIFTCGILALFFMITSVLFANINNNASLQTSSSLQISNSKIEWGIKRADNNMQPDLGKKNKELIEKYNGMAMGNEEKKYVYITFDLGYEAGYTEKILVKVLRQNDTYSIVENYEDEELQELGYTDDEISKMGKINVYDEIVLH